MNAAKHRNISDAVERVFPVADEVTRRIGWFVARNVITNYGLEGVAFNAGPMASVANTFHTLVNNPSVMALWVPRAWVGASGVTATSEDYSFSVVNNWIYGGRYGQIGDANDKPNNSPQRQHFTGNMVELYPEINAAYPGDYPGAASYQRYAEFLNLSGNTLIAGGHGAHWTDNCTNALVLKNDFGAASYRALTVTSTNTGMWGVIGAKNILNQGSASHVRGRAEDAQGWFLFRNSYRMNGSTNNINSFIEPFGSPVHFVH